MTIKDFVPPGFKDYLRLIKAKHRFPGRQIRSFAIGPHVRLGSHCLIDRDVVVAERAILGDYTIIYRGSVIGKEVILGNYSYVNAGSLILSGHIGHFCSISYSCQVGMPEHPVNWLSTSPYIYGDKNILGLPELWEDTQAPPTIGNDVWIGAQAIVLQGVNVGHGAIIAAGAVVTKDVPAYAIVAGVPAKIIRHRYSPSVIDYLLQLKWWEMPLEQLTQMQTLFSARDKWIEHIPLIRS